MATKTASKTLPLTLPPEIRLIICEFFFADVQQQHFPHSLLRVSSTIRNECIPILFTLIQLEIEDRVDVSGPWLFGFQSSRYATRSLGLTKGYTWETICELPLVLDLLPLVRVLDVTHVTCCYGEDHEASTTIKFHGGRDAAGRPNEVDFLSWFDGVDGNGNCVINEYTKELDDLVGEEKACSKELAERLLEIMEDAHEDPHVF